MEPFLSEEQFARLYGLLQQEPKIHTKDRARERRFLEAVYWMGRSGAQWRFLPAERRLPALRPLGRVGRLGAAVPGGGGRARPAERDGRRHGGAGARLRRQRAQPKGDQAAEGLGRSRGGFSTKLHVLVDALGNPLKFIVTSGAAGDNPQAIPLLAGQRAREVIVGTWLTGSARCACWAVLAPRRALSSRTPTSRRRSATAGRRARGRESPPGAGRAATGTRAAPRHRPRPHGRP